MRGAWLGLAGFVGVVGVIGVGWGCSPVPFEPPVWVFALHPGQTSVAGDDGVVLWLRKSRFQERWERVSEGLSFRDTTTQADVPFEVELVRDGGGVRLVPVDPLPLDHTFRVDVDPERVPKKTAWDVEASEPACVTFTTSAVPRPIAFLWTSEEPPVQPFGPLLVFSEPMDPADVGLLTLITPDGEHPVEPDELVQLDGRPWSWWILSDRPVIDAVVVPAGFRALSGATTAEAVEVPLDEMAAVDAAWWASAPRGDLGKQGTTGCADR
jgi:hypothetical protein